MGFHNAHVVETYAAAQERINYLVSRDRTAPVQAELTILYRLQEKIFFTAEAI